MADPEVAYRDGVCEVTLREPGKHNPLSPEVLDCLEDTAQKLHRNRDVRVFLLRGEGVSFSSGADLRYQLPRAKNWRDSRYLHGRWQRTLDALESLPQVSVGELHGAVFGGAFLLAITCDIRVACDDTRFCIPELRLGIPLTWAGLPRLAKEIGLPRTREIVMTGRIVSADEALSWGLVASVTSGSELPAHTRSLVTTLLDMPHAPLAITKDALAAIGRERMGSTGWADADFSLWSREEDESVAARRSYVDRLSSRRRR
jgi:enoyl-CoA hydratase/carnithine racemase